MARGSEPLQVRCASTVERQIVCFRSGADRSHTPDPNGPDLAHRDYWFRLRRPEPASVCYALLARKFSPRILPGRCKLREESQTAARETLESSLMGELSSEPSTGPGG